MLSSSANVPLRLIATTESNMTFSFDESIRAMVSNMLKNIGEKSMSIEEILAPKNQNSQEIKYLFHSCNECLAQNKKKTVKEKTLCNKEEYYLVKIDGFSDYSETWIRPKKSDIYSFSLFHRMNLEVERVVAWHRYTPSLFRPINHVRKSYKEIYEIVKNRNLRELDFTSGEAFYYLIKWKGLDYSCCTWEHEFLLKNQ